MADWNKPTIASNYITFVEEINNKFYDVGTGFLTNIPLFNLPENIIKTNRTTGTGIVFQEFLSNQFVNKTLDIAGGGTGSATSAGARTNLGLGSMATQNSNAVAITGGSISGVAFDISTATGIVPLARGGTGSSLALGAQGDVFVSWGGIVQMLSGQYITSLNASYLSAGTIPDARLSANVGMKNATNFWVGQNTFWQAEQAALTSQYGYSVINQYSDANPAGSKRVRFILHPNTYWYMQSLADDYTNAVSMAQVSMGGVWYIYGAGVNNLNGANISHGQINQDRLGAGGHDASTFLRGDGWWAVPPSGGGTSGAFVPSGMIAIFTGGCPSGWSRYAPLDNRFPLGSTGAGAVGGSDSHVHNFDQQSGHDGDHSHSFGGSFGGSGSGSGSGNFGGTTGGPSQTSGVDAGGSFGAAQDSHTHGYNVAVDLNVNVNVTTDINGQTGGGGGHSHRVAGNTDARNHIPPYYTVVFCMKD